MKREEYVIKGLLSERHNTGVYRIVQGIADGIS